MIVHQVQVELMIHTQHVKWKVDADKLQLNTHVFLHIKCVPHQIMEITAVKVIVKLLVQALLHLNMIV